jgi:hypothetical protein
MVEVEVKLDFDYYLSNSKVVVEVNLINLEVEVMEVNYLKMVMEVVAANSVTRSMMEVVVNFQNLMTLLVFENWLIIIF